MLQFPRAVRSSNGFSILSRGFKEDKEVPSHWVPTHSDNPVQSNRVWLLLESVCLSRSPGRRDTRVVVGVPKFPEQDHGPSGRLYSR